MINTISSLEFKPTFQTLSLVRLAAVNADEYKKLDSKNSDSSKLSLKEMCAAIKEAIVTSANVNGAQKTESAPVDSKVKEAVDTYIKNLVSNERALVNAALLGDSKVNTNINGVQITGTRTYDVKTHKLTIKLSSGSYNKTEVKDLTHLQERIKTEKEEAERPENPNQIQQNLDGTYTIVGPNGERIKIKLPKFPH